MPPTLRRRGGLGIFEFSRNLKSNQSQNKKSKNQPQALRKNRKPSKKLKSFSTRVAYLPTDGSRNR